MAPEKIVKTTCQACDRSCGILCHVKDGKIVKIEGDPGHPVSGGMVCPKGIAQTQVFYHPDRLKYPLKRIGERGEGKWQRILWDEALDTIAKKLTETAEKLGIKDGSLPIQQRSLWG